MANKTKNQLETIKRNEETRDLITKMCAAQVDEIPTGANPIPANLDSRVVLLPYDHNIPDFSYAAGFEAGKKSRDEEVKKLEELLVREKSEHASCLDELRKIYNSDKLTKVTDVWAVIEKILKP